MERTRNNNNMPEAKPIAIVYLNIEPSITDIQTILEERWPDYHVIVVKNTRQERAVELEVFYDKNFTDTNYEDLKKWITEYLTPKK